MDTFKNFSDYDLLAHVPQGFLVIAATDKVIGTSFIIGQTDWSFGRIFSCVIISYALGHIIASASSLFYEKIAVEKLIGRATFILLQESLSHYSIRKFLFPSYIKNADYSIRTSLKANFGITEATPNTAETAFWRSYRIIRNDEYTKSRIRTFQNLYGFCRNTSFVSLIFLISATIHEALNSNLTDFLSKNNVATAIILAVATYVLFSRYLKFYRLYALEVIIGAVSTLPPQQDSPTKE